MDLSEHIPPEGKKWLCQRCGNCCRWPGTVIVTGKDIDNIAAYLEMEPLDFLEQYVDVTPEGDQLTIIENPDHSCALLDDKGACSINPVKPEQCQGFPNAWNFPGWQNICEATLVDEEKFEEQNKRPWGE